MVEHLLEMAKALVKIRDGEIEVLSEPRIASCPLRRGLYGWEKENRETVERSLREHMQTMGMYGTDRILETDLEPVAFGASEILMDGMREGLVDAAVMVCEGAGTVVIDRPEVLQAVGAHMTGLLQTDPIKETQDGLSSRGCLLLDSQAGIDQLKGFEMAIRAGYRRIAVTIAGERADDARALKEKGDEDMSGARPLILAVHTTGISEACARTLADNCDLVWSCASKAIREVVSGRDVLQIGVSIPVFALTLEGRRLLLNRALHYQGGLVIHRASLPLVPEGKQPDPLI
jgi:putative methanogenesis marker protein 8